MRQPKSKVKTFLVPKSAKNMASAAEFNRLLNEGSCPGLAATLNRHKD